MSMSATVSASKAGTPMRIGLWVAQAVAASVFCFAGYTKLMSRSRSCRR